MWVLYFASFLGLGIDALLAVSVIGELFDLPEGLIYLIVFTAGILAAVGTTKAATAHLRQQNVTAICQLVFVAAIGVSIAAMRYLAGLSGTQEVGDATQFGGNNPVPATEAHSSEWAMIGFILTMYFAAVVGIFSSAVAIFVPERGDLKRHDREQRALRTQLGTLEAQNTAIHERLSYWKEKHLASVEANYQTAHVAADAREAALKAYARDAIARAVGRADATPLVRAPHEPVDPESFKEAVSESEAEPAADRIILPRQQSESVEQ